MSFDPAVLAKDLDDNGLEQTSWSINASSDLGNVLQNTDHPRRLGMETANLPRCPDTERANNVRAIDIDLATKNQVNAAGLEGRQHIDGSVVDCERASHLPCCTIFLELNVLLEESDRKSVV